MSNTEARIESLQQSSAQAGDEAQVELCTAALDGDAAALAECQRVLDEADAEFAFQAKAEAKAEDHS